MVKAIVIAALGGVLWGRWIRNGWLGLLLLVAFVAGEASLIASRHDWSLLAGIGMFYLLDGVGSASLLVGLALQKSSDQPEPRSGQRIV